MVNNDILQIKCPWCSAVLSVKNRPDIETKNVTCPVCKQKSAFNQFTLVSQPAPQPKPPVPPVPSSSPYEGTKYSSNAGNLGSPTSLSVVGQLVLASSGAVFQLHQGRNVIGRMAPGSVADFQIETPLSKRMSRQHIVVDVMVDPLLGVVHALSLFKQACNAVTVNGQPLVFGDRVILTSGMSIAMPDAILTFQLPDPEKTILE